MIKTHGEIVWYLNNSIRHCATPQEAYAVAYSTLRALHSISAYLNENRGWDSAIIIHIGDNECERLDKLIKSFSNQDIVAAAQSALYAKQINTIRVTNLFSYDADTYKPIFIPLKLQIIQQHLDIIKVDVPF